MKFRRLNADEIDVKVGNVTSTGYTLLLYKNARVDMAILDETVGAENWQRDHKEVKGNLYCGIGIDVHFDKPELDDKWVWKWDCGVESAYGDKEKGEASDSFKRAGFNWGLGRELYTSPFMFIPCKTNYDEGKKIYKIAEREDIKRSQSLSVKSIEYNDKGEITKLIIVDGKGIVIYPINVIDERPQEIIPLKIDFVCENCGETITSKVAEYSKNNFGKALCFKCQKEAKK